MPEDGTITISERYKKISSFHLTTKPIRDDKCRPGDIIFTVDGVEGFSHEAWLNPNGVVSRMALVYDRFGLQVGDVVGYGFNPDKSVTLFLPANRKPQPAVAPVGEGQPQAAPQVPAVAEGVFRRKNLAHLHLEAFRPQNLLDWEPENETDVFMVFGSLQDYTPYRYCCGMSKALMDRLGYAYKVGTSKPDAVVIEDESQRYLIAEWKKNSSDFALNHDKDDVDVLIVWNHDEADKTKLPTKVIGLREIAKLVAAALFSDQDTDGA